MKQVLAILFLAAAGGGAWTGGAAFGRRLSGRVWIRFFFELRQVGLLLVQQVFLRVEDLPLRANQRAPLLQVLPLPVDCLWQLRYKHQGVASHVP